MIRELAIACEDVLGVKLTHDQEIEIQHRVIQQFGGERIYVPRRPTFVMGARYDLSGGVHDVMRRYQVSRSMAYKLMRRK